MPLTSLVRMSTLGWNAQQKRFSRIASRSDCSILVRASALRSMPVSKNAAAPLPLFLTRYIAISAFCRSVVVALAVLGIKADTDRGGGEDLRAVDEERRADPLQHEMQEFRDLV